MELPAGVRLAARFRVTGALGAGGGGTTYRAWDEVLGRDVALKVLRTEGSAELDAMRDELAVLRGVFHPRITRVLDVGRARVAGGALPFYASELVEGAPIAPASFDALVPALVDALEALGFLHDLGFLHGDVKPENVIVDGAGRATLIDLGCSARLGTASARVSGTFAYLPPEVLRAGPAGCAADRRRDLFSFGVMLRALAPGDPRAEALAERLTRTEVAARPSDVTEVMEALGHARRGRGVAAPPAKLLGRGAPLAMFERLLAALVAGAPGPRVLIVEGREGAGRTRLLHELRWRVETRGLEGADVTSIDGDARSPLGITSMLRRATEVEDLPPGLPAIERAREALDARAPVVMVLDDADALEAGERELWVGLARSATPRDRALWVVSCSSRIFDDVAGDAIARTTLGPLEVDEVAAWTGLDAARARAVHAITGGFPAAIRALAARDGAIGEGDIHLEGELSARAVAQLTTLGAAAREAVGLVAASGGALERAVMQALGVTGDAVGEVVEAGLLAVDGRGARLVKMGDAAATLAAFDEAARRELHARLGAALRGAGRGAEAAPHLARGGDVDGAKELIAASTVEIETRPDAWCAATRALAEIAPDAATVLRAGEVHEAAGRAKEALTLFAQLLATHRGPGEARVRRAARLGAAGAYLKLGAVERAEKILARWSAAAVDDAPELAARGLDRGARVAIRRGAWAQARSRAEAGLALGPAGHVEADLRDDLGVAASYLGDVDVARVELDRAAALHAELGRPRSRARSATYRALLDYRRGDVAAAARGFREAQRLADDARASDLSANAALNLATAAHQAGDLGEALEAYGRALAFAVALDRASSAVNLRANLAKLFVDLGQPERAEQTAREAITAADARGMDLLAGAAEAALGEANLQRGDATAAAAAFRRGRARFVATAAARERTEIDLQIVDALLHGGDVEGARAGLDEAMADVQRLASDDLTARAALARARVDVAIGAFDDAARATEQAAHAARRSGQALLVAEVEAARAEVFDGLGASVRARKHAAAARAMWERTAAGIPAHMRDRFWQHPARRGVIGEPRDAERTSSASTREQRLARLLDINKKLSASLDPGPIVDWTIDHALELTRAERGFVVLARDGELAVAATRNTDTSPAGERDLAFSRGIAARVVAGGAPVVTVDAEGDQRFAESASVHAMRLKSVLCVPIRAAEGVIGALYVDHRFRRDLFDEDAVEVLLAFADQVAIALTNARLHAELARRTAELDVERARIQRLLEGQEAKIESLEVEVREKQAALERRYDGANIVGRGAAMQAMFATLDRVCGTTVTVLVTGESGTGKELVARAIHFNGPRKAGPFVAINCGALPESLLESELFGHEKGAFTGASRDRAGLFVAASGGTLLLDELGEMPPSMQVKLLRVLQERVVTPIGARAPVAVDVRIVCATNRDLKAEVARGAFRADLYYRVAVVELRLPPLRERLEDLPELAARIVDAAAKSLGRPAPRLGRDALRALGARRWPGNVRELENTLTKAVVLASGDALTAADLDDGGPASEAASSRAPTRAAFVEAEDARLLEALEAHRWNVVAAAKALGMPRATLYRRLKRLGAARPRRP